MKKMGRKMIMGTAMAACAVVLSACGGGDGPNETVYGPPPEEPEIASLYDSGRMDPSAVSSDVTNEFDPSTEINEDVYGPPEYWE